MSQINLSVVLPCYNERDNVTTLIENYQVLAQADQELEIIFVDNGSTDGTGDIIKSVLKKSNNPRLRTVNVPINNGYGFGILQGLKFAEGRFLAWSHADLQCPPEDVLKVFKAMKDTGKADHCFGKGVRVNDRGNAHWLTRFQEFLTRVILGITLTEINAQPKVLSRKLFECFRKPPFGYELDIYAYYKATLMGHTIVPVDVVFLDRQHGQSKWSFSIFSRFKLMFRNFIYLIYLRVRKNSI